MPRTHACLWFDNQSKAAADFYVSVFPNSEITHVATYPEGSGDRAGQVLTVEFTLDGTPYMALDGGPEFTITEAVSFVIECADQDEIDYYWQALGADGGREGPCGWVTDTFGVSWQVTPANWNALVGDDPARASRVFAAMMKMGKLNVAELEAAAKAG